MLIFELGCLADALGLRYGARTGALCRRVMS